MGLSVVSLSLVKWYVEMMTISCVFTSSPFFLFTECSAPTMYSDIGERQSPSLKTKTKIYIFFYVSAYTNKQKANEGAARWNALGKCQFLGMRAKIYKLFTSGFPEYFRFHFSHSSVVLSLMFSRVKAGLPKKEKTNDRSKMTLLM